MTTATPAPAPAPARKARAKVPAPAPASPPPPPAAAPKRPTAASDLRGWTLAAPTANERAMYEWACSQAGTTFDLVSFVAGRRLQGPWQKANREKNAS